MGGQGGQRSARPALIVARLMLRALAADAQSAAELAMQGSGRRNIVKRVRHSTGGGGQFEAGVKWDAAKCAVKYRTPAHWFQQPRPDMRGWASSHTCMHARSMMCDAVGRTVCRHVVRVGRVLRPQACESWAGRTRVASLQATASCSNSYGAHGVAACTPACLQAGIACGTAATRSASPVRERESSVLSSSRTATGLASATIATAMPVLEACPSQTRPHAHTRARTGPHRTWVVVVRVPGAADIVQRVVKRHIVASLDEPARGRDARDAGSDNGNPAPGRLQRTHVREGPVDLEMPE